MKISELVDVLEDEKKYIDILLDVATAFSYNTKVRKEIDSIYESDRYHYYKVAKESKAYSGYAVTMGGITNEVYAKRALGVILCAEDDLNVAERLIRIIRRNFFHVYSAVESKKENKLNKLLVDMIGGNLNIGEEKTLETFIIYLIVKLNADKESVPSQHMRYISVYMESKEVKCFADEDKNKLIDEKIKTIDGIKKRIEKNKGSYLGYEDLYNSKDEMIHQYVGIITALFDLNQLSASRILSHIKLTEDDINEIILSYTIFYNDKNLERSSNVLVNGIIIKSLILAYKEVRETFIKNNKETLYFNMEELEDKVHVLKSENNELQSGLEASNKQVKSLLEEKQDLHKKKIRGRY